MQLHHRVIVLDGQHLLRAPFIATCRNKKCLCVARLISLLHPSWLDAAFPLKHDAVEAVAHFVVRQQSVCSSERRGCLPASLHTEHGSARGRRCLAGPSPLSTWSFYWGIRSARRWDSGSVSFFIANRCVVITKGVLESFMFAVLLSAANTSTSLDLLSSFLAKN